MSPNKFSNLTASTPFVTGCHLCPILYKLWLWLINDLVPNTRTSLNPYYFFHVYRIEHWWLPYFSFRFLILKLYAIIVLYLATFSSSSFHFLGVDVPPVVFFYLVNEQVLTVSPGIGIGLVNIQSHSGVKYNSYSNTSRCIWKLCRYQAMAPTPVSFYPLHWVSLSPSWYLLSL